MSNLKHYLGYGLAIAALLLVGRFWLEEHDGRLRAEAQQQIIDARDKAQAQASAQYEAQIAALKSPDQAKPLIQQGIQSGSGKKEPVGAFLSVPFSELTPQVQQTLPDAPSLKPASPVALLTPDQQVDLGKRELVCEKTEGELSTCAKDKQNLQNEINDLKGGSKWSKVVKEAKCLGVLGAGAGIGAKLGGWKGAIVGGVSGEAGCKIFF